MKVFSKSQNNSATGGFRHYLLCRQILTVKIIFFGTLLMFLPLSSTAQDNKFSTEKVTERFVREVKTIYGVDDELINGYPYLPPNRAIKSHPYFKKNDWFNGSIYMNGEAYHNMQVKYDLVEDAVILKAELQQGVFKLVHLNSLYVDSLRLNQRLFTHSRKYFPPDSIETFYEQVYSSPDKKLFMLIHYSKKYLSQYTEIAPRGRFSDTDANRFLISKGKPVKVNRKRTFLKQFNRDKRRELRRFMKQQDIRYRSATRHQLQQLMNYSCENIFNY